MKDQRWERIGLPGGHKVTLPYSHTVTLPHSHTATLPRWPYWKLPASSSLLVLHGCWIHQWHPRQEALTPFKNTSQVPDPLWRKLENLTSGGQLTNCDGSPHYFTFITHQATLPFSSQSSSVFASACYFAWILGRLLLFNCSNNIKDCELASVADFLWDLSVGHSIWLDWLWWLCLMMRLMLIVWVWMMRTVCVGTIESASSGRCPFEVQPTVWGPTHRLRFNPPWGKTNEVQYVSKGRLGYQPCEVLFVQLHWPVSHLHKY